jgi:hypothetical protein
MKTSTISAGAMRVLAPDRDDRDERREYDREGRRAADKYKENSWLLYPV